MKITRISFIILLINIIAILAQEESLHLEHASELSHPFEINSETNHITSQFSLEWEQLMSDYEPDYVYMIPVPYKRRETFYETITKVPSRVKGAYLLDEASKETLDFSVISPSGHVILQNTTSHFIFDFNATEPGTYRIIFDNRYSNTEMKVTFTMNTGKNPILKKEDLSIVDVSVNNLLEFMKNYGVTFRMRQNIHHERYKKQKKVNKYFYTFSMFETIFLIGVSVWQFYYMRQLVKTK